MAQAPELWLPPSHEHLMTDQDRAIHEEWAAIAYKDVINGMGTPQVVELSNGDSISVVDKRLKNDEPKEALAVVLPFNNGYTPSNDMRAGFEQAILDAPMRTLIFPTDLASLDVRGEGSVRHRMARNLVEATRRMGVEKLHISGFSMGAMLGAAMMPDMPSNFDVSGVGIFLGDTPNETSRSEDQLEDDFTKGGLRNFNKAINDSGLPALSRAQHARGGLDLPQQLFGFARFARSGHKPFNALLHGAMASSGFASDITVADHVWRGAVGEQPNPLIIRMAKSLICKDDLDQEMERIGYEVDVVSDYGHEGGDNIVLHGLLGREAIRRAKTAV
jgi:hypothetical protein